MFFSSIKFIINLSAMHRQCMFLQFNARLYKQNSYFSFEVVWNSRAVQYSVFVAVLAGSLVAL